MHFYNRCLPFHYGTPEIQSTGTCEPCNCNGNSDQCNTRTGDCIFCENNTTGRNCERCKDGFYGNATLKTCKRKYLLHPLNRASNDIFSYMVNFLKHFAILSFGLICLLVLSFSACECNTGGSVHITCDHVTGQCDCHPGVGKRVCSECLPDHYGFFNTSFTGKRTHEQYLFNCVMK